MTRKRGETGTRPHRDNKKITVFSTGNIILFPAVLFLILSFSFSLSAFEAFAQSSRDEYKRIQKDLKTHKKKLESVKKVEKSVLQDLRKTNAELNEIERQLKTQKEKIKKIQNNITGVQTEIKDNEEAIQVQGGRLKKRVRTLQRLNIESDALLILISGEDISQTMRIMRYIRDVSAYDYSLINKYKETVRQLNEKQDRLKRLFSELKAEEVKLAKLDESLKDKKKERETLLVSVRKEKSTYQKMINELKEASNRLMRIIQESERHEKELRKKKGTKGKPGTKEDDFLEDSSFSRLKGRLPWPVNGSIAIQYGTQVDPLFNLPVFRSGIHIKASNGSNVKAVHEGKVVFADDFKGYGQLVIVSHGSGYHTLYGSLSKIFLKNGAIIKDNQALGEVGESNTLGTPGLYFEVRYKGKSLDPQQWLRK